MSTFRLILLYLIEVTGAMMLFASIYIFFVLMFAVEEQVIHPLIMEETDASTY